MPFVTDRPLSFALRELRLHFSRPPVLVALAGIGIILGVAGPFDSFTAMPLAGRLPYWLAVVVLSYAVGFFTAHLVEALVRPFPTLIQGALTALGVTATVTPVLLGLNAAIGVWPDRVAEILFLASVVLLVALAIQTVGLMRQPASPPKAGSPAILNRLPLEKRGPLVSLSVRDHYVDVVTIRGREMLLMRLGDAIRETEGVAGLQVHRSHWVAQDRIARVQRRGDAAVLLMQDDTEIPVSRSGLKLVQNAGLLPARRR